MALADLLRAFERDAAAEIHAIADQAAADAAEVTELADRVRTERIAATTRAFGDERRRAIGLEIAAATRDARVNMLRARAAMLDRIRRAAAAELPARFAGDPRLASALEHTARAFAGDETGELQHAPTGVVLELASGTRIDATLAALLDREWPQLACDALALERAR